MKLPFRLPLAGQPQETKVFLFVGAFGLVLAAIYWFLTYEVAGTILLGGFGLGALLLGIRLWLGRPAAVVVGLARGDHGEAQRGPAGDDAPRGDADVPGGGTGGVDVPFSDERGRLPSETLAPLSLGLGVALALTAVVFGPWLFVAGILPLGWGAWAWLHGARDELAAIVEDEAAAPLIAADVPDVPETDPV